MKMSDWMYKFHHLQAAVTALYYSAYWHPDRPVDEAFLWTAVRNAAEIEPGKSAERLGPDRSKGREVTREMVTKAQEEMLSTLGVDVSSFTMRHVLECALGVSRGDSEPRQ